MKPFEGPQRILKIKCKFIFYLRTGSGHEGLTGSRSICRVFNGPHHSLVRISLCAHFT